MRTGLQSGKYQKLQFKKLRTDPYNHLLYRDVALISLNHK